MNTYMNVDMYAQLYAYMFLYNYVVHVCMYTQGRIQDFLKGVRIRGGSRGEGLILVLYL